MNLNFMVVVNPVSNHPISALEPETEKFWVEIQNLHCHQKPHIYLNCLTQK